MLVSAGGDQVVKLWDVATRQEIHSFRGHKDWISSVAFSNDGHYIVSASVDKAVKVWEVGGGEGAALRPRGRTDGRGRQSRRQADRFRLGRRHGPAVGHGDGRELFVLKGHTAAITALAFTPDGKYLVTTAEDKTMQVWDCATGKEKLAITDPAPSSDVPVLAVTPDGKRRRLGGAGPLEFYDLNTGKQTDSANVDDGLKPVGCLAFSLDGSTAAVGRGRQGAAVGFGEARALQGGDLQAPDGKVVDLTLSADKKVLATADETGLMKIWDAAKRKEVQTLKAFTDANQRAAAFVLSADGSRLATAGVDSVVRLWDAAERQGTAAVELRGVRRAGQGLRAHAGLHARRQADRHGQRQHDDRICSIVRETRRFHAQRNARERGARNQPCVQKTCGVPMESLVFAFLRALRVLCGEIFRRGDRRFRPPARRAGDAAGPGRAARRRPGDRPLPRRPLGRP